MPVNISAPDEYWGKMWARCDSLGRWGRLNSHVKMYHITDPSGISTEIGSIAILLFRYG